MSEVRRRRRRKVGDVEKQYETELRDLRSTVDIITARSAALTEENIRLSSLLRAALSRPEPAVDHFALAARRFIPAAAPTTGEPPPGIINPARLSQALGALGGVSGVVGEAPPKGVVFFDSADDAVPAPESVE